MEEKADLEIIKECRYIGRAFARTKDRYAKHVSHVLLFTVITNSVDTT